MPTKFGVRQQISPFRVIHHCSVDTSDRDLQNICLKVGSTGDLLRRMDQWQRKCPSKQHILRGHWPGGLEDGPPDGPEDEDDIPATADSAGFGPKGPLCCLVERLTHLELADLVINKQYLNPDFTLPKKSETPSPPKLKPTSPAGKIKFPRHQCTGCMCLSKCFFIFII